MSQDLAEEVLRLRARVAELEATVANERGQGAPPVEGWEWGSEEEAWEFFRTDGGWFHITRTPKGWTWDADRISSGLPHFDTARDAMRAALVVPDAQR